MIRGFKYRLHPTPAQAQTLEQWIGAVRFVYNLAWEQRSVHWRRFKLVTGRNISWPTQSREVTDLRRDVDWIAAVPRVCLEQALRDLDGAYANFFRGAGYPSPRRKGDNDAIRFQAKDISVRRLNAKWDAIRIPNLGWVKYRNTRDAGKIIAVTVTHRDGVWGIAFHCEIGAETGLTPLSQVGIDRGITNTVALSNGELYSVPRPASAVLARSQRVLARRKRGSKRYIKQRLRVARIRAKAATVRRAWLHRVSTDISRRFGVVAIEALKVGKMTASAKGTVENPGSFVGQKAGLNRSILEQGWGMFSEMLAYKLEARGGHLLTCNAAFTSQTCAECGVIDARSRESQAIFKCIACDHVAHADTNAARNILRQSMSDLLVEGPTIDPVKREPALAA